MEASTDMDKALRMLQRRGERLAQFAAMEPASAYLIEHEFWLICEAMLAFRKQVDAEQVMAKVLPLLPDSGDDRVS